MIIYGWGHFNRREHSLVRDTCRACGKTGYLRSYTSSKFFTLYFIPVIPLGREKVVQECPHCKQAYGMSLRKWHKLRREDLPAALAAYEAAPADPEAARRFLGTCIGTQDAAALQRVGPQIRTAFSRDAAILGLLAGTYSYLCLDKEADAVYLDAVALSPDGPVAAEAQAHLELQNLNRPSPPSRLLQSLPVLIVPAILLFVAVSFLEKAVNGGLDDAYLVNGLDRPYTVVVNGEPLTLRPHVPRRTDALAPGENMIEPGGDARGLIESRAVEITVTVWDRMFGRTMAVVNPDCAAVVAWERSGYAIPKAPDNAYETRVNSGQAVHMFSDIDFPFASFPEQISMSGSSGVVYRTRVTEIGNMPIEKVAFALLRQGSVDTMAGYLRARLRAGAVDTNVIHLASRFLPRDEFLAVARARIAEMPVQIEWHRAYQTLVEGTEDDAELVATYRALVERHPDDSALVYLYGRVIEDPAESVLVFERAARMPLASAYAANALVYHHLLEGDFAQAVSWSAEAVRLDAGNPTFRGMRLAALYGAGEYQTVEREVGDPLAGSEQRIADFQAHLYRLARLQRSGEVPAEIDRFVKQARALKNMGDADEPFVRAALESAAALGARDRARYVRCMARIRGDSYAFQAAVLTGDLERARKLLTTGDWSPGDQLLLYVLMERGGQHGAAAEQLASAIAALKQAGGDERRWAAWLSGADAPTVDLAAHTCSDIQDHAVYLHALATRHPARAGEYLKRAARIQWMDTYASLALDGARAPE